MTRATFAQRVVAWQREHGRHDLPWQNTRDPYRIWLSEVMLQQTQVATVLPYYQRFLASYPDVAALAAASVDDVLAHWSGLGYYRRAHHLHAAARQVMSEHGGVFPRDSRSLVALSGIGRSTAAAIASFASGERGAILDGNVKRVVARHRAVEGHPSTPAVLAQLWRAAESLLPDRDDDMPAYTQGVMDLGATVCLPRNPGCLFCPVANDCVARIDGRIDAIPAPKPLRTRPHRAVRLLLIEYDERILLEHRPPTGVWGGLWSLPEVSLDTDPRSEALRRFAIDADEPESLPEIRHGFTHFELTLHPQRLRVRRVANACVDECVRWLAIEDALVLGLPSPIRKLLRELAQPDQRGIGAAHARRSSGRRASASG